MCILRKGKRQMATTKNLDITKCTEQVSETKNGINFKLKFEHLKNIAISEEK